MQAFVDDPAFREQMGTLAREEMQRHLAADLVFPQFAAFSTRIASELRKR
jgi:hypothetical protein